MIWRANNLYRPAKLIALQFRCKHLFLVVVPSYLWIFMIFYIPVQINLYHPVRYLMGIVVGYYFENTIIHSW